jgi:hypothetical protein
MKILRIEIHERYVLSDVGKYVREGPRFPSFNDIHQKRLAFPHGSSNAVPSMDITAEGDKSSIRIVEEAKPTANPIREVSVPWLQIKGILESEFVIVCVYSIE